ncbi:MAG: methyltransferase domain-containing protein [Candidatus Uhrbacteria bacterium]
MLILILLCFFLLACLFALFFGLSVIYSCIGGVPWVRTKPKISQVMLEMADVQPGQTVLDLGCGEGSILFVAAKKFKAKGIGFDNNLALVLIGRWRACFAGLSDQVQIYHGNVLKKQLPKADIITCYLLPEFQVRLESHLLKTMPSGTKIVCHAFKYPNLKLLKTSQVDKTNLYLYQVP